MKFSLPTCAAAVAAAALLLSAASPAEAGPWLPAGDRQVRQDVELLKTAGFIPGPLGSWPMPWMQVAAGMERARTAPQPPHVEAALRRLEALSVRDLRKRRVEAEARFATDEALLRDFEDTAREEVDIGAQAAFDSGRLTLVLGGGYREGQDGSDFHIERSYAAYALGNWALYGGYVQHWWGPGQDSALLFSNNARPIPQIGVKRLLPTPIDLPVLRWLGPVKFDAFLGILTEERERSGFDNPALIGFRAAFQPAQGLEIGLNRGLQLCGEDRPCGAGTIFDALFPFGDADNTGTFDEPGNQLGGFDISYRFMAGDVAANVYTEWEAEDEAGLFVLDRFVRLFGATASGPLGAEGATWNANVEYTDTLARGYFDEAAFLEGVVFPGIAYNNFIYSDGFTYRGEVLGASIGSDSDLLTLRGSVTDARNRRAYAAFRQVEFNKLDLAPLAAFRSANRETIGTWTLGSALPTRSGDFNAELRYQGDRPSSPGNSEGRFSAEIGWRTRF